ncbi:MAG: tRNA epoxyqueuosine(34) reductase QueG [Flavobacteriales bacterium]|nr:tRNA epoxyqueuosine(34) reductase QueG [Flavobacteriales bacterium]
MQRPYQLSLIIKNTARDLGFDYCGISKAEFMQDEARQLEEWLNRGMHGKMKYMENHFDKRTDPTKLVEGAKSVISLLYNYYPEKKQQAEAPQISKYAYGEDYHFVIKDKLKELVFRLQEQIGNFYGRIFVDSAPVLEKAWAKRSGLGWIGKHTNLINRNMGSFFFIAEIICDLECEPDSPIKDYCGTCTRCIDACPTDAIVQPYVVDGSKCISYFTIELREEIPQDMKGKFENWMFGCDICQDVCPWNRFAMPHHETRFLPNEQLMQLSKEEWMEITVDVFDKLFKNSPLKRAGWQGIQKNLKFLDD